MKPASLALAAAVAILIATAAAAEPIVFTMMTWTNDWTNLPTAVGLKPSYNNTNDGPYTTLDSDWLIFTPDDKEFPNANEWGAFSSKFNDRVGLSGMAHGGYESCNSLTGWVTLAFMPGGSDTWAVDVLDVYTLGSKATSTADFSRSYLVTTNTAVIVSNSIYGLDGLGNTGVWHGAAAENWALSFSADSWAVTPGVWHTEEYKNCLGCIIPVDQLTTAALAQTTLAAPSGYYTNDFRKYLAEEIAPRLPQDARYLLFVQILKSRILYSTNPNHVDTNATLFGECWFATTPQEIVPEPIGIVVLGGVALAAAALRRRV